MSDSCKGRKSTLWVKDQRTIHDRDLHIRGQKTNIWTRTFIFLHRTKIIKIDVWKNYANFSLVLAYEELSYPLDGESGSRSQNESTKVLPQQFEEFKFLKKISHFT